MAMNTVPGHALSSTTPLQQRVRSAGIMSPSLLHEGIREPADGFENGVIRLLDGVSGT